MRLSLVLCTAALANTAFAAALVDLPVTTTAGRRALDGIFDGLQDQDTATAHDHATTGSGSVSTSTLSAPDDSGLKSLLGLSSSVSPTSTKGKGKEAATVPTGTSYSIIGSLPPIQTPSAAYSATPLATSTSSSNTAPPTATAVASTASTASTGTSEWKIVGVAVIAFTTIAAILLLSVFFDQWWRFVRDSLICCRRKKELDEELVPDWEKAEWDLRCGPDRQRYPSFSSLPSIARVQPPPPVVAGPSRHHDFDRELGQESVGGAGWTGYSLETRRERTPSGIGLGLGRVGSVRSEGSSPGGGAAGRSPSVKRGKTAYEAATKNPFDDIHSPTPEDVYGGVAH